MEPRDEEGEQSEYEEQLSCEEGSEDEKQSETSEDEEEDQEKSEDEDVQEESDDEAVREKSEGEGEGDKSKDEDVQEKSDREYDLEKSEDGGDEEKSEDEEDGEESDNEEYGDTGTDSDLELNLRTVSDSDNENSSDSDSATKSESESESDSDSEEEVQTVSRPPTRREVEKWMKLKKAGKVEKEKTKREKKEGDKNLLERTQHFRIRVRNDSDDSLGSEMTCSMPSLGSDSDGDTQNERTAGARGVSRVVVEKMTRGRDQKERTAKGGEAGPTEKDRMVRAEEVCPAQKEGKEDGPAQEKPIDDPVHNEVSDQNEGIVTVRAVEDGPVQIQTTVIAVNEGRVLNEGNAPAMEDGTAQNQEIITAVEKCPVPNEDNAIAIEVEDGPAQNQDNVTAVEEGPVLNEENARAMEDVTAQNHEIITDVEEGPVRDEGIVKALVLDEENVNCTEDGPGPDEENIEAMEVGPVVDEEIEKAPVLVEENVRAVEDAPVIEEGIIYVTEHGSAQSEDYFTAQEESSAQYEVQKDSPVPACESGDLGEKTSSKNEVQSNVNNITVIADKEVQTVETDSRISDSNLSSEKSCLVKGSQVKKRRVSWDKTIVVESKVAKSPGLRGKYVTPTRKKSAKANISVTSHLTPKTLPNLASLKTRPSSHVTMLCLELHVQTRPDLLPDPVSDPIAACFYKLVAVEDDWVPVTGLVVVGEPGMLARNKKYRISYVSSELVLVKSVARLVRDVDPDFLAGYEVQMSSWGYLSCRASTLGLNMYPLLSRLPAGLRESKLQSEEDNPGAQYDANHTSEIRIVGRTVLNVWRLLRSEVALYSYSLESVVRHVLGQRRPHYHPQTLSAWWSTDQRSQ